MRSLLAAALVASLPSAAVTLQGPADIASLAASADAVLRAQVVKIESAWAGGDPKSGLIVTFVDLRPIEVWKGDRAETVRVQVPGGAVGDLGQISQGAATFEAGEEVVVFLQRRAPGTFQVERWALGKFKVRPNAGGEPRALRSRDGITCRECRPGEADELPLAELKAKVLAVREAK